MRYYEQAETSAETSAEVAAPTASNDEISVAQLVERMSQEDRTVAITAGRQLWSKVRRAGRPGADDERAKVDSQLRSLLGGERPRDVRREILWMLSEIGDAASVDAVAILLSDRQLREDACLVLQRMPGDRALDVLRSALDTADESFRPHIAQSLRARGVPIEGIPCQKLLPVKPTEVRELVLRQG